MPHSINGGLMSLRFCMAVLVVAVRLAYGQVSALGISPAALNFGSQPIGTSSGAQSVVFTNNGTAPLTISAMVLTGIFYNDFSLPSQNICVATLAPGGSCTLAVTFTPGGTSTRTASLSVMGNFASPQTVSLTGNGLGTCVNVTNCAFQLINQRVDANQNAFFVYEDGNSAFNHGYISLFGTVDLTKVGINAFCVDDPALQTGCSSDAAALDGVRGTVVSFTYPPMAGENYVGLDFLDPENYNGTTVTGNAYNLTPATAIQFEARSPSPSPAVVQFGVGGCVSDFYHLTPLWSQITIQLDTLFPPPGSAPYFCPPDLTETNVLFSVATDAVMSPSGGTVLLDNIQFTPVPARQTVNAMGQAANAEALSFPLGDQSFGVVPVVVVKSTLSSSIPPDQVNLNVAAIYESAATLLALLRRGQPEDVTNALEIANTFDYALHHENHGDPLPVAPDGSVALHDAYTGGDIAFLNALPTPGEHRPGTRDWRVSPRGLTTAAAIVWCWMEPRAATTRGRYSRLPQLTCSPAISPT